MTATVGTARASVLSASALYSARRWNSCKAPTTTRTMAMRNSTKKSELFFGGGAPGLSPECIDTSVMFSCSTQNVEIQASWIGCPQNYGAVTPALQPAVNDGKDARHKEKSSQGGEEQAADDRAAQGRVLLAAFAKADGHGHHADDHRECGHNHGTHTDEARLQSCVSSAPALVQLFAREGNHQDAVRGSHTHTHDSAGQRRNAQGCVGEQEHPTDPRQRARQSRDDDKRIKPGLEIDDDEWIGKNDGADQPNAEAHERGVHGLNLAADECAAAPGEFLLDIVHELRDFGSHRAEIASIDGGIHIDHRLDIVMRDGSRACDGGNVHQIAEDLRGSAGKAAVDRSVLEGLVIIHAVLRSLDGNGVADAVLGIEPEVWRGLEAG